MFKRIFVIVLDSVGIGNAPDAALFNDLGANTVDNIAKQTDLYLPNLAKMGLGKLANIKPNPVSDTEIIAHYSKMDEMGLGKDTIAGHWEMMGVTVNQPFGNFCQNGFPQDLIDQFSKLTNRAILGNIEANGMQVINQYYDEHLKTGALIIYTSVDSTFQIAAHEAVVPISELYTACEIARKLTSDPKYNISRVIARPFIGDKSNITRTSNRHDYALTPPTPTTMKHLKDQDFDVICIGKIGDIFNQYGVTKSTPTKSNLDGIDQTIKAMQTENIKGLIFTNLVEFDSTYGHVRDVEGYKNCLEQFDQKLPILIKNLKPEDMLIITADHGNDPTFHGNDHTREEVPLFVYHQNIKQPQKFTKRHTFADLGATISENFSVPKPKSGQSFLKEILK